MYRIDARAHRLKLRFFLAASMLVGVMLGCVLTLACEAHAATPDWILRAADRIPLREHRHADHCGACLSGRGHRKGGYCGPYQFGHSWNPSHAVCAHGIDWRACYPCSRARFIAGAERGGKRWVRRHWRATCGGLR